ncbi:MAG: DMT family transporter [Friedmanniella sp.]
MTSRRLPLATPAPDGVERETSRRVSHGSHPHWLLTLPMMLTSGGLITLQAQVNGALAHRLGTGLRASALAAVISFGSGLVVLTLFALVNRPMGRGIIELGHAVAQRRVPLWLVLGGLGGAFFVASQGLAAGRMGITFFVICFVAGQAVMALLVDHQGWGPNGPTGLSAGRVVGAALAVVAVAISGAGVAAAVPVTLLFLLVAALPLVAGLLNSLQQGVNGRLSARFGSWVTTWNNFFVGTLGLTLFLAATLVLPGRLVGLPREGWLYLGGLCGIGFIWASAVAVRIHGVLVVGVFAVAGQVVTAALISLVSASGAPPLTTWLAALTSLLSAAVVGLSQRARPR